MLHGVGAQASQASSAVYQARSRVPVRRVSKQLPILFCPHVPCSVLSGSYVPNGGGSSVPIAIKVLDWDRSTDAGDDPKLELEAMQRVQLPGLCAPRAHPQVPLWDVSAAADRSCIAHLNYRPISGSTMREQSRIYFT